MTDNPNTDRPSAFRAWCDAMGRPGVQLADMLGVCYATFCSYRKNGPPPQSARLVELACRQLLVERPASGGALYMVEGSGRDPEGIRYRWFDGADSYGSAVEAARLMQGRILSGGAVNAYRIEAYTDVTEEVGQAMTDAQHAEDLRVDAELRRTR